MPNPDIASRVDPKDLLPQPTSLHLSMPIAERTPISLPMVGTRAYSGERISFAEPAFLEPKPGALPRSLEAFPQSYFESRARFLDLVRVAGGRLHSHQIEARGPGDEALHIDIAVLGSTRPKNVLLHLAGVHGVEGFVGAAIQSEILRAKPLVEGDCALVLVHCLNPWGMAHLRRSNEDNVDLNRNFLGGEADWRGTPPGYSVLNGLLNPKSQRDMEVWFYPSVIGKIMRHGFSPLKQAVLDGQYDNPQGLMFGGHKRAESTAFLDGWLRRELSTAQRVIGIDVHAGMGPYARQTLFVEYRRSNPRVASLGQALEMPLTPLPDSSESYTPTARGAVCNAIPALFDGAKVDWFLQEFGTFSALKVLHALRRENFLYHHGTQEEHRENAQTFLAMFNPTDFAWREQVLRTGVRLAARAASALNTLG